MSITRAHCSASLFRHTIYCSHNKRAENKGIIATIDDDSDDVVWLLFMAPTIKTNLKYIFCVRDTEEENQEQEPVSDKRIFSLKWIEHVTSIIIRDRTQRRKWSLGCSDWEKIIPQRPSEGSNKSSNNDNKRYIWIMLCGWLIISPFLSFSTSLCAQKNFLCLSWSFH